MIRRTTARIVAAIVVPIAMLVALLAWGASSPPGSSPDDDYHMASIWCANGDVAGQCEATNSERYRALPADLVRAAACFKHEPTQSASCPLDEGRLEVTDRGNWVDHSYPPLFYQFMGLFVGEDLSVSIIVMRSVGAAVYVAILTALFFLVTPRQRRPLLWGAAISIVPLGMFLIPSVNPSAWAILSATGLWIATWGWFEQTGARKWMLGAAAGLLMVMGAGARSDAAVYGVLALIVASVLSFSRDRRYLLHLLLPAALAVVAVAFFFSGGQSAIVAADTAQPSPLDRSTLAFVDAKLLPQLWIGVFGFWGLGWLDTAMPGIVWVTVTALFAAIAFLGLRRADAKKWIVLAGVALSLIVVPMYILLHDGVIVGSYVQPRYIYPLIILFAGVVVVGFRRASLGMGRVQLLVVALGLTVANSVALHVNLRRYITGSDVPNFNLNAPIEWWWNAPIAPMTLWVAGSLAAALVAAALTWVAWDGTAEEVSDQDEDQSLARSS